MKNPRPIHPPNPPHNWPSSENRKKKKKKKKNKKRKSSMENNTNRDQVSQTSAEKVAGNEDLLSEILLRLPVRSLVRFKCVSKPWLLLISGTHFSLTHTSRNARSLSVSGLFFPNPKPKCPFDPEIIFIRLPNKYTVEDSGVVRPAPAPAPFLEFLENPRVVILQSCKGLMLCSSGLYDPFAVITVCNPTTNKFSQLPPPPPLDGLGSNYIPHLNLAFDPSRSPHYVVVRVSHPYELKTGDIDPFQIYRFQLYSSHSRTWSSLESPLTASVTTSFEDGVFCNGSLYWCNSQENLLRFHVDNRCFETINTGFDFMETRRRYLGECKGKLYLVVEEGICPETYFVVYEMGKGCSEWLVKYSVNLGDAGERILRHNLCVISNSNSFSMCCSRYSIFGVVGGLEDDDDDKDLGMLIQSSDLLFCDFKDKTPRVLFADFEQLFPHLRGREKFEDLISFQYVESLSPA